MEQEQEHQQGDEAEKSPSSMKCSLTICERSELESL